MHSKCENACGGRKSFWKNGFFMENGLRVQEFCCSSTWNGLHHLKEKGMLHELPDGGHEIISSPNTLPFVMPLHLKHVNISKWKIIDQTWLNV